MFRPTAMIYFQQIMQKQLFTIAVTCLALLLGASLPASAAQTTSRTTHSGTVLSLPGNSQAVARATLPQNMMTKAQVRREYGQPHAAYPPVGQPPITRWDYPDFVVYFEYQYVLNSVIPGDFPPIDHRSQLLHGSN